MWHSLIEVINQLPRGYIVIYTSLVFLLVCTAPGYLIQRMLQSAGPHDKGFIPAFLWSLLFNTLLSCFLSSWGLYIAPIVRILFLLIFLAAGYYFYQDRKELLRSWWNELSANKYPVLFFLILLIIFMVLPRLKWVMTMHGVWAGDPLDRMARVRMLLAGFNIWEDIIPGEYTWYPPVWTTLMATTHYLCGVELSAMISSLALIGGIICLVIFYLTGKELMDAWSGDLLILTTIGLALLYYIDLPGTFTPQGLSFLLVFTLPYCLALLIKNPRYILLASINAGLALLTYPQAGYIAFAIFVITIALFTLQKETRPYWLVYLLGLILVCAIASIYWVPFTMKYGISPPEGSWLRSIYKVSTPVNGWKDLLKIVLLPRWIDIVIILIGAWMYDRKKEGIHPYSFIIILSVWLAQYLLRWHHLITEPLMGFSIQPDRFIRYDGFSRGLLFCWAIYQGMQSLIKSKLLETEDIFQIPKPALTLKLTACILLLTGCLILPPWNEYYRFTLQIYHPPTDNPTGSPLTDQNINHNRWIEENGLLAMTFHPRHLNWELKAAQWIQENTPPQSTFLSPPWQSMYYIAGLGGRRVFVNLIPYHGPMDPSQPKRAELTKMVYTTTNPFVAEYLVRTMQVDYVVKYADNYDGIPLGCLFQSPMLTKVYQPNEKMTIYKVNKDYKTEAPVFPMK